VTLANYRRGKCLIRIERSAINKIPCDTDAQSASAYERSKTRMNFFTASDRKKFDRSYDPELSEAAYVQPGAKEVCSTSGSKWRLAFVNNALKILLF
jgi:hypothetical protein